MENKQLGLILLAGIAIVYFSKRTGGGSVDYQRSALINLNKETGEDTKVFYQMSDTEISDVFTFIFDYVKKGKKLTQDNPLWYRIEAIGKKYNIFT